MISIVTLIDNDDIINNKIKNIDTLFDNSITSIINQTFQDWELKIVIYNISYTQDNTTYNYNYTDRDYYQQQIERLKPGYDYSSSRR